MSSRSDGDRDRPADQLAAASPSASPAVITSTPASAGAARPADAHDSHSLPIGTRLDEFELIRHIGDGGFSVVYLAHDHSLDRQVALKEYMPAALATRLGRFQVNPRSERHRETFDVGMKSFINEAKLLAQFDHPSLVKVFRFWEANGTAYMAMPFYQGSTLKETVRAMPAPPDEAWLLGMLGPLTDVLELIHKVQCYHRDIAPDNLILLHDDALHPLLLDFGAARRVIGDLTQALTVILKPGYAPVEQYAEVPGMRQGPWTDVYALAAVVYWTIMGRTPPPAVGRMMQDTHVPLAACAAGRYSPRFIEAVDRALIVAPDNRTRSIAEFREALGLGRAATSRLQSGVTRAVDPDATLISPANAARAAAPAAAPSFFPRSTAPAPSSWSKAGMALPPTSPVEMSGAAAPPPAGNGRQAVKWAAGGALGLGLLAAAAWWAYPTPRPVPPRPEAAAPLAPDAASASAGSGASTPASAAAEISTASVPATRVPVDAVPVPAAKPKTEAPPGLQTGSAAPSETASPRPAPLPEVRPAPSVVAPAAPLRRARESTTPGPVKAGDASLANKAAATPRKAEPSAHSAECAQIFQRLSLGENRPDLVERATALKCR